MHSFKTCHPTVNFFYFLAVLGFSAVLMHPICLILSLLCALAYSVILCGGRAIKLQLCGMLPLFLATALLNPTFNHAGITILAYLPGGNPLTLESLLYGVAAATMLIAVLSWFVCLREVLSSDKYLYLFGKILPALSLLFSMTLGFIPRFKARVKAVAAAQNGIAGTERKTLLARAEEGLTVLSVLTTWSLETAVETADSMKSRGHGLPHRTAFSHYRFTKRDVALLLCILGLSFLILNSALCGNLAAVYFPAMQIAPLTSGSICTLLAYFLLCALPILLDGWEVFAWKRSKSRI